MGLNLAVFALHIFFRELSAFYDLVEIKILMALLPVFSSAHPLNSIFWCSTPETYYTDPPLLPGKYLSMEEIGCFLSQISLTSASNQTNSVRMNIFEKILLAKKLKSLELFVFLNHPLNVSFEHQLRNHFWGKFRKRLIQQPLPMGLPYRQTTSKDLMFMFRIFQDGFAVIDDI